MTSLTTHAAMSMGLVLAHLKVGALSETASIQVQFLWC